MFVLYVFFLTLFAFALKILIPKLREWNKMRIEIEKFPGRKGYPIIGNLLEMSGDRKTIFSRTYEYIEEFKDFGTVRAWLFNISFLMTIDHEVIETVLSSTTHLAKGIIYNPLIPWLGTGLLTSTGPKWHHRRKMLTPAFHFNILQNFLKIFNNQSKNLVKVLGKHSNQELDIIPVIAQSTLNAICETAMGTPLESLDGGSQYSKCIHEIGEICIERIAKTWTMLDILYFFTPTYWRQRKILKYLHKFSMDVIKRRREVFQSSMKKESWNFEKYSEKKKFAMLDILLLAQIEDGRIDDEGIREEVDTFMFEDKIYNEIISVLGTEDNPTYFQLQELRYLEMCIKESLRLYPSVSIIARYILEDIKMKSGQILPAGSTCTIGIFHMHRREDIFPNPEIFDPDRFLPDKISARHPFAYIPFSAGSRNCIGQKFAMLEIKSVITAILRNFILEPVDTPDTIDFLMDLVLRPAGPIRVKFVPRNGQTIGV